MSVWDKYGVAKLPEEQRADVIKEQIKEHEQTQRARLDKDGYHIVRGFMVVVGGIVAILMVVYSYYSVQEWKEVKIKDLTLRSPAPMVCPPPPPVTCPPQAFDIHVSPAAPTASAAPASK